MRMLTYILCATVALSGCGGGMDGDTRGLVARSIGTYDGPGGCGVRNALHVTEVSGVTLSQPAILSRAAARHLNAWVRDHAVPIIGRRGGGLAELKVASHYACRNRNSQPGARMSEHALGNAIDISAFELRDGSSLSVLTDWDNGGAGRTLSRLRRSACGPFGTVLGPGSDAFHSDHFHFDVADHRNGPYCE